MTQAVRGGMGARGRRLRLSRQISCLGGFVQPDRSIRLLNWRPLGYLASLLAALAPIEPRRRAVAGTPTPFGNSALRPRRAVSGTFPPVMGVVLIALISSLLVIGLPGVANAETTSGALVEGDVLTDDGKPAADVPVVFHAQDYDRWGRLVWTPKATTKTDAAGHYISPQLAQGHWRVSFGDAWERARYRQSWYSEPSSAGTPATLALADSDHKFGIDGEVFERATISGTLVDYEGLPASGVSVGIETYAVASGWQEAQYSYATTDANGRYLLTGLSAGKYRVVFSVWPEAFPRQWWKQSDSRENAQEIVLEEGQDVDGINGRGQATGSIAGTVVQSPIEAGYEDWGQGIEIIACPVSADGIDCTTNYAVRRAYVNGNGTYAIPHVPVGEYVIRFQTGNPRLANEWWPESPALQGAERVIVSPGQVVEGINASLTTPSGTVRGRLVDEAGQPANGVYVGAYMRDVNGDWTHVASASTTNGTYELTLKGAGDYKLEFSDQSLGRFATQWYRGGADLSEAEILNIDLGTRTLPELVMHPRQQIRGRMTDNLGAPVAGYVYAEHQIWNGTWQQAGYAAVSSEGDYAIEVDSGHYRVQFVPESGLHAAEYYLNSRSAQGATLVRVGPASGPQGVDGRLDTLGRISGTIRSNVGAPLSYLGIWVRQYDGDTSSWGDPVFTGVTDYSGRYTTHRLEPGRYRLYARLEGHDVRWNGGAASFEQAKDIVVGDGETVSLETIELTATGAPETKFVTAPREGFLLENSASFSYSSNEAGSTYTCALDGAPAQCDLPV